jgi:hypothetical protein
VPVCFHNAATTHCPSRTSRWSIIGQAPALHVFFLLIDDHMVAFPSQHGNIDLLSGLNNQWAMGGDDKLGVDETLTQVRHDCALPFGV